MVGHLSTPLKWVQRLIFITAASLLVFPTIGSKLLGIGLAPGMFIWARGQKGPC